MKTRRSPARSIALSLVISLGSATGSPALARAPESRGIPGFTCGRYVLKGTFHVSATGQDLLRVFPGSERELEVRLLNLPARESFSLQNETVEIEVDIVRPAQGSDTEALFQRLNGLVTETSALKQAITRKSTFPDCGNKLPHRK